jgi:ADP-ribose pyrophosphatase
MTRIEQSMMSDQRNALSVEHRYIGLRSEHPALFINKRGGIEILPVEEWSQLRGSFLAELVSTGHSPTWGEIGVVYEDQYILVLRDPVRFMNGKVGTYIRVLEKPIDRGGAVIVASRGSELLMIRQFRHATRRWHLEFPRGFAKPGEDFERVALRELIEETGAMVTQTKCLGTVFANNGLLSSATGVVFGIIHKIEEPPGPRECDWCEMEWVTCDGFEQMVKAGTIDDGITISAFLKARLAGVV